MSGRDEIHQLWLELGGWCAPLTSQDVEELEVGSLRVLRLMIDRRNHDREEICTAAGGPGGYATEGLRRMRELRKIPGVRIEKERLDGKRTWIYRLELDEVEEPRLPFGGRHGR